MNTALYDAAKTTFGVLFGTVWRMRVFGAGNVPSSGPAIVACNHLSYLDPPVLGTACPRRIAYMAKRQLFAIPVLGPLIMAVGAYPVDREGSAASAIRRSVQALRRGEVIGIFPEGTRNLAGVAQLHEGVALLASLAQAPVVPACIVGTKDAVRLRAIRVAFGRPLRLESDRKATRDDLAKFTGEVMRTIRSLSESIGGD